MHDRGVDWREQLEAQVLIGRGASGDDEVRGVLQRLLQRLDGSGERLRLAPPIAVLGVDGCKAGWVGVLVSPDGRATLHVASSVAAMVEQIRGDTEIGVVAIDIPIGLPHDAPRQADLLARAELPGKASSVFLTAPRVAYLAPDYAAARAASVAASRTGASLSAQAWALTPKILEVDAWVRSRPSVVVIESHPELSFARMNGAPVLAKKKSPDGVAERRELLSRAGLAIPAMFAGMGFEQDDLLDACAIAWTAVRHATGRSVSYPADPEVFSDGISAAIWV